MKDLARVDQPEKKCYNKKSLLTYIYYYYCLIYVNDCVQAAGNDEGSEEIRSHTDVWNNLYKAISLYAASNFIN